MQRLRVRDRGLNVVGDEPVVERVVLARGELEHALIERRPLVPQARHASASGNEIAILILRSYAAPCSAAESALVSATTSVPVPSLVKISASSASGAA